MVTIKCNKCGIESNNPYAFDNVRFSYIDENSVLQNIHLCEKCQLKLLNKKLDTMAVFIGEKKISSWNKGQVIL